MTNQEFTEKRTNLKKEKNAEGIKKLYKEYMSLGKKTKDQKIIFRVTYCRAIDAFVSLDFPRCQKLLNQCVNLMSSLHYQHNFCDVWNLLGLTEFSLKNSNLALFYYKQGMTLAKKHGNNRVLAMIHSNISMIYGDVEHEKAIQELKLAISLIPEDREINLATFYMNLAIQYKHIGDIDKAFEAIRICIEKYHGYENNNPILIDTTLLDLYYKRQDFKNFQLIENKIMKEANTTAFDYHFWNAYEVLCSLFVEYEDYDKLNYFLGLLKLIFKQHPNDELEYTICYYEVIMAKKHHNYELLCQKLERQNQILEKQKKESLESAIKNIDSKLKITRLEQQNNTNKKINALLKHQVANDPLTNLLNRHAFNMMIRNENKENYGEVPFSVLIIDIDNFKYFNDTYGHLKGDNILQMCGQILQKYISNQVSFYRYGGDEFVGIVKKESREFIQTLCSSIQSEIYHLKFMEDVNLHFSVTIGVFYENLKKHTILEGLEIADKALYSVKNTRGQVNIIETSEMAN